MTGAVLEVVLVVREVIHFAGLMRVLPLCEPLDERCDVDKAVVEDCVVFEALPCERVLVLLGGLWL